jgi:hypothetical protein
MKFDHVTRVAHVLRLWVVATVCLFAQAVPAFAEKVTLACSYDSNHQTAYLTIDTDTKTVKDAYGTFQAQITDDLVTWYSTSYGDGRNVYNRQSALWYSNGAGFDYQGEVVRAGGPVPCVRAPPRPF